jgi:hypothetical protein
MLAQERYVRNIPIVMPYPNFFQYHYTPKQIFPCPDGGIMVLGNCTAQYEMYPDRFAADCGVIKLNAAGNCEWQWWSRNFYGSSAPQIIGIDQEADGRVNFLINTPPEQSQIGWIDPQENYSLQDIQLPNCVINRALRLPNSDIFTIGLIEDFNSPINYTVHALFMRLDAQGDTLSTRHYAPDTLWVFMNPGNRWARAYDMELDTDGMPVATCQFTDRFASVVKTDWNGNLIWRRDTNTIRPSEYYPITFQIPITKLPVTEGLIFGYQAYNDGLENQFCVFHVSPDGLDSLFTIQTIDSICAGSYYSMISYNQGIYLSGCYGGATGTPILHEYISNYSLTGDPLWTFSVDSDLNFNQGTDCITILPDNNIMHVFSDWNFGNSGLTVIKLHPDGTANEDELLPKPTKRFYAYPNPMKSSLSIDLNLENNKNKAAIPIQIYNIKGQLVRMLNLDRKSNGNYSSVWDGTDVNGKPCANGTYILRLHSDNDTTTAKIVLIK